MREHAWLSAVVPVLTGLLGLAVVVSCSDPLRFDFTRPSAPRETALHDLVTGPIERPSAFDVVAGRGRGLPRAVRVDQTDSWDIAFGVQNGDPVWLPRAFFDGFEESGGITRVNRGFEEVTEAPAERERYEEQNPVPVEAGAVYVIRSRPDRSTGLPCRLFAKLEVLAIEGDPPQVRFRYLWNPNCDRRDLIPEEGGV